MQRENNDLSLCWDRWVRCWWLRWWWEAPPRGEFGTLRLSLFRAGPFACPSVGIPEGRPGNDPSLRWHFEPVDVRRAFQQA